MQSRSIARSAALALLAGFVATGCAGSDPAPANPAPVNPALEPVTYENLYEREQYWPDHVMLTEPWKPEGFEGERFGYGLGILVRVEPSGDLRIDYARLGQHRVPARVTNVIEQANRIRLGEVRKPRPKFVFAVANKLFDPNTDPPRYVNPIGVGYIETYLIVAADPASQGFAEIASALAPIRTRSEVMLVLFPQGALPDDRVLERCKEVGWTDPFLISTYVPGFTASIFGDLEPPRVILQSPEGRVIHSSAWSEGTRASLEKAIERELGPAKTADPAEGRGSDQKPAS
ncbi:MAG: hypothetical protein L0206_03865 [Actinobacteria bacterium]|nr:hypothetical protein [Actinomycetota bacterium]